MDDVDILLGAYPFQDLSRADLETLLPSFRRRSYRAGQPLWHQGDDADTLCFVIRGQVQNVHTHSSGEEIVTGVAGAGESFGQPALFLPGAVRIGTCIATVATEILILQREPLLSFLERHPAAMRRMLESMSLLTLSQMHMFREVWFHDVRSRVAYQLLRLADNYGQPATDGTRIALKLSQGTLAGLVAASRESVNRALAGFLAAGDIRHEAGYIVVTRPMGLRQALNADHEQG